MTRWYMALLFFGVSHMLTASQTNDHVIARCAGVELRQSAVERMPPTSATDSHGQDDKSQLTEQRVKFDRWIIRCLLDFASERYSVKISPDELAQSLPSHLRNEAEYRRSFEPDLAMVRAAKRVALGEDADRVFAEDLARYPMLSPDIFKRMLTVFSSVERVDTFLAKDQARITREAAIADARRELIAQHLAKRIERDSRSGEQDVSVAKAKFWNQLLIDADVAIFDERYTLPSFKGVL